MESDHNLFNFQKTPFSFSLSFPFFPRSSVDSSSSSSLSTVEKNLTFSLAMVDIAPFEEEAL